ncbi:MAG: acyl carrier protein [Gorillibacterium sp.]|nr:acyl carrier protein [Gorillibacterium sp.]
MNKEQVELQICEMISRLAPMPGDGIKLSDDLRNTYGVDSLILVELLVEIEEAFDIVFDSSSLTGEFFSTAGTIANYVSQKLEAA